MTGLSLYMQYVTYSDSVTLLNTSVLEVWGKTFFFIYPHVVHLANIVSTFTADELDSKDKIYQIRAPEEWLFAINTTKYVMNRWLQLDYGLG